MFARSHALHAIGCFAFLLAVIPAWSADPDKAKSTNGGPEPLVSVSTDRDDKKSGQAGAQPASAVASLQEQQGDTQGKVERSLPQPGKDLPSGTDAGKTKAGDDPVAPRLPASSGAPVGRGHLSEATCSILKKAAAAHGLPVEFFARVIWTESRFKPRAIGPTTRTGHRAQGIAQFMPYTATARGLADPFNPELALPEAAEFLAELRREFGNLGLAAAAYNAGPGRVHKYLSKRGGMPAETRHYVRTITGRTVEDWARRGREPKTKRTALPASCLVLAALVKERPLFSIGMVDRKVHEAAIGAGETVDLQQTALQAKGSIALPETRRAIVSHQAKDPIKWRRARASIGLRIKRSLALRTRRSTVARIKGSIVSRTKLLIAAPTESAIVPPELSRDRAKDLRKSRAALRRRTKAALRAQAKAVKSAKLTELTPPPNSKSNLKAGKRVKAEKKSRTRRSRAASRRTPVRTARDDRIDKIMRICSGCGL